MGQLGRRVGFHAVASAELASAIEVEFVETYRKHVSGMMVLLQTLVPAHVAEEIAHDVFVIVWSADGYRAELGTRRGYLHGIARHKALDWIRRQYSAEDRDRRWAALGGGDGSFEELVCAADDAARVRRALQSLGSAKREAISLAYFGGLSYRQVAVALDLPEGTVKTRIRDGLTQLRQQLSFTEA